MHDGMYIISNPDIARTKAYEMRGLEIETRIEAMASDAETTTRGRMNASGTSSRITAA